VLGRGEEEVDGGEDREKKRITFKYDESYFSLLYNRNKEETGEESN
jgi:hypothetical protein